MFYTKQIVFVYSDDSLFMKYHIFYYFTAGYGVGQKAPKYGENNVYRINI